MNLTSYVETLRHELLVAAESGGPDAVALAERLTAPLDSAARLVLLEALSAAADEITRELAPGSVDVRLRGRDPEFVVTPPPSDQQHEDTTSHAPEIDSSGVDPSTTPGLGEADDGGTWRTTLRLPEHFKPRIEEAAGRMGISVNAWHVRAAAAALEPGARNARSGLQSKSGGQRYSGWVR
ncbi:MAG: hypothetical protein ABIR57_09265 [Aeromicrobium sp.]